MNTLLATLTLLTALGAGGLVPPVSPEPASSSRSPASSTSAAAAAAVWPLAPQPGIVTGFAPGPQDWSPGHRGVDLLGRPGQPVLAALGGTVRFAGTIAGRGVVSVDHGGFRTTYEPVSAALSRGARVQAGDVLGRLQAAQSHCPPRSCLHWGLIEADGYADPLGLLGLGPVRLLPLRPAGAPSGTPSGADPW